MTADPWHRIIAALLGVAPPPLPELPGRVHRLRDDDEPLHFDDLRGLTNAEAGRLLGVSRQRAHQILKRLAAGAGPAVSQPTPAGTRN